MWVDALRPGIYGFTFANDPDEGRRELHWDIDADAGYAVDQRGRRVTLRPFIGVMGNTPAEPGRHNTAPPRQVGSNLDCKELVVGSTLYLPIKVEGALFLTGDGHARQGDGEVSRTAIECPMDRCALTFSLRDDLPPRPYPSPISLRMALQSHPREPIVRARKAFSESPWSAPERAKRARAFTT